MRAYKYGLIFITGMTALAAEFGASRLLQNVFGSSNLVWSIVIGLILVYFSVGYWYGGRRADQDPTYDGLFRLLAIGALALGVTPLVAAPLLRNAALAFDALNLPVLAGAFVSTIIIFSLPITLLATVTPYMIRLEGSRNEHLGGFAGRVSAISTLGSVLGAFLPTLFLFGTIGTAKTIILFATVQCAYVAFGWFLMGNRAFGARRWLVFLLPLFLFLMLILYNGPLKITPGQVYETESDYNYIEVLQYGGDTFLRLNEGQGFHSQYNPDTLFYGGPWEQFLVAPLFLPAFNSSMVSDIAIVGLAAGTSARQARNMYPQTNIDGFEIDGKIVEVGKAYFGLDPADVNIHIGDGRSLLAQSSAIYDIIAVDAYRPPYIPPHLTTVEFFEICKARLKQNGMVAINVGRTNTDRRLINDMATTLSQVFERVFIMDLPGTMNSIIFAGPLEASIYNYANNYAHLVAQAKKGDLLLQTTTHTVNSISSQFEHGNIYTDDRSQIEWATNGLVLNFLFSEQNQ